MTKATVKCNGVKYEGWKGVSLFRSIDTISSSFRLEFKDSWTADRKPFGLNPQDEIRIEINGVAMLTGYIDSLDAGLKDSTTYTATGRDRSADLVDCSVPLSPAQYKNLTLLTLCNTLAKETGVTFRVGVGLAASALAPFPVWAVQPDEKIFESIERACRTRGVLMVTDGSGQVYLSGTGVLKSLTPLIEGENIKSISYKIDYSERYSDYTVRGQDRNTVAAGFGGTSGSSSVKGTASDAGVKRKRRLTIQAEAAMTNALAKSRAQWEATVRAARSLTITVVVYEWVDSQKIPWRLNTLITLKAPKTGIEGTFLIASTDFGLDETGGSETTLTLLRPDAFTSEPVVPKKNSDQVAKGFTLS